MSKPTVKVKDKEYSVSQISVVLKLNSCPLIYLRLSEKLDGTETKISNEETFKQEFFTDICSEAEGSFEWGGTRKFFLVGYNSPEARAFELVGLVVKKDLIDWFNQNNFKEKKEDYLIYQKGKGKNSWSFFNMVLGDKFKQPSQDFINKTDLLFPDNSCIWRYKESNNFHFLNRAMAFASRHLPQVQGWCGFDDYKPLRLIIFEEEKQDKTIPKLDNIWAASSYPFVPNRYSWNRWLDKSSTLTRELSIQNGREMPLIKKLTSHGLNDEDGKSYQAQNPTQLLFSPGTITIGEKNVFCHTITYEFKLPAFGEESPSVTMKIEVDYPELQIGDNKILSLRLPGKFKEWHQQKDEETEIKIVTSDLNNWGIIDEGSQSLKSGDNAVLSTQILSRTYSDKKYSGIYIKHKKDDEMIVDIHPCSIPLVLGSVQKYRKELEEADVTLSGQKLAISVSEHHQSLDKSEAIVLDNSEIKLNHGKKIFGQAQHKIDFLSQNLEIGSSEVEINSSKTNINSFVNISFPSPKVPTPNITSTSGITGVRSSINNVNSANKKKLPASLKGGGGVSEALKKHGVDTGDMTSHSTGLASGATGSSSAGGVSGISALPAFINDTRDAIKALKENDKLKAGTSGVKSVAGGAGAGAGIAGFAGDAVNEFATQAVGGGTGIIAGIIDGSIAVKNVVKARKSREQVKEVALKTAQNLSPQGSNSQPRTVQELQKVQKEDYQCKLETLEKEIDKNKEEIDKITDRISNFTITQEPNNDNELKELKKQLKVCNKDNIQLSKDKSDLEKSKDILDVAIYAADQLDKTKKREIINTTSGIIQATGGGVMIAEPISGSAIAAVATSLKLGRALIHKGKQTGRDKGFRGFDKVKTTETKRDEIQHIASKLAKHRDDKDMQKIFGNLPGVNQEQINRFKGKTQMSKEIEAVLKRRNY